MKIIEISLRIVSFSIWIFFVLPITILVSFLIWESMPLKHWYKVLWVYIMKESKPEEFLID